MSERQIIRVIDRDTLWEQARSARPFPHIVMDNFLDPDFAHEVLRSWPSFEEASRIGTTYRSVNERLKVNVAESERFPPAAKELNRALASEEWMDSLSYIFGIPNLLADPELYGGGLHQTGPRGHLDVHVDFNYIEDRELHRRLNVLVFFNEPWETEWGGRLELWNSDVSECIHSLEPIFNRCVVFQTSEISFHGVTQVTCPPDKVRRSFAGYYYTKEAPPQWTGESHSTIFKPRPDEWSKRPAMAINRARRETKKIIKKLVRR